MGVKLNSGLSGHCHGRAEPAVSVPKQTSCARALRGNPLSSRELSDSLTGFPGRSCSHSAGSS